MANIAREVFDGREAWPIRQVTVYEDRAQITRILDYKTADFGEVELKLENLPMHVVVESVRAEIESGNATVLEVAHKEKTTSAPLIEATDREKEIQKLTAAMEEEKQALNSKSQWLTSYAQKAIPNSPAYKNESKSAFEAIISDKNLDNFDSFLDYYEHEMSAIEGRLVDIEEEKRLFAVELGKSRIQAQTTRTAAITRTREVAVLLNILPLEGNQDGQLQTSLITVKLVYVVHNASWAASYDVRVFKTENLVALSYYGKVVNNTGEIWPEVIMSLSTAKPSRPGNLPKLPRAEVRVKRLHVQNGMDKMAEAGGNENARKNKRKKKMLMSMSPARSSPNDDGITDEEMSESAESDEDEGNVVDETALNQFVEQEYTETEDKGGSAVFKLARLCSVDNDGKPHKQTIGTVKLIPTFVYVISPKISANCFLKCNTQNGSNFVFVPGPMAVFFNDSFVTTTKMDMVRQNEAFSFYLGIEESVKVDYQPEISKTDNVAGLVFKGKTKTQSVSRTIRIINTRQEDINCVLFEQVPLARDEKIKVEVISPQLVKKSNGESYKLNKFNHLEAKKKVDKDSTWEVKFEYKLEWPKERELNFTESLENMRV